MQLTKKSAIIERTFQNGGKCANMAHIPKWRDMHQYGARSTMAENAPIYGARISVQFRMVDFLFFFATKIHIERMNEYFGTQI